MHQYQVQILRELLLKEESKFSELKKSDIENYHFNFHLKTLIKDGYITKSTNGLYSLTTKGKQFSGLIDTDNINFEKQAKLSVALHPIRKNGKKIEVLFHKRLKQPYFGYIGSQSGKIKWGENQEEGAKRELLEETGLTGLFKLKEIVHVKDISQNGELLEDKYFWVYFITQLKGKLFEKV